ncbi:squalene/phytoene synthase family protein [Sphingomonas sp. DC1600-2]|uniref:squalene/phytoene synthase family protein n=1 Tax=unclassified Sphingomonas TaxID=196159 RepID=UPI003CF75DF0
MIYRTNPERMLALSYAPQRSRAALAAVLALDDTLGQILRTTREPLVGQMRLTWWHEALVALDTAPPPAQPVLQALAAEVLPRGISGATLAGMIDGWEVLLDPDPLTRPVLEAYAAARGEGLFAVAGQILGATARDPLAAAGAGWALADLSRHARDAAALLPAEMAATALADATRQRWSPAARALGALAHLARMDLSLPSGVSPPVGAPRRVARLAWHRFTGR